MALKMTQADWYRIGLEAGWCSPQVCLSHDGPPMTEQEEESWFEEDNCLFVVRLYVSDEERDAVELNHPPSVWRKYP